MTSIAPSFYAIAAYHAAKLTGECPSNVFLDGTISHARYIGALALLKMFPRGRLGDIAYNMRVCDDSANARNRLDGCQTRNWFNPEHVMIVFGALLEHEASLAPGEARDRVPLPHPKFQGQVIQNLKKALPRPARVNLTGNLMGDPGFENPREAASDRSSGNSPFGGLG